MGHPSGGRAVPAQPPPEGTLPGAAVPLPLGAQPGTGAGEGLGGGGTLNCRAKKGDSRMTATVSL